MMPIIEIIRLEESEQGTFGVLRFQKQVTMFTLERPDLVNVPTISSIPPQQYICERWTSPKFGNTFIVKNVPNRAFILFHPGNSVDDTEGCILLGMKVSKTEREILDSVEAFNHFMQLLNGVNQFHLTIYEHY